LRHLFVIREGDGSKSAVAEGEEVEFGVGTTTVRNCEKWMIEGKEQHHDDQQQGENWLAEPRNN
jgi:hypothetical protein